jgi:hypothetical protein
VQAESIDELPTLFQAEHVERSEGIVHGNRRTEMKSNHRINLILGLAAILSAGLLQGADCVGSFMLPHQTNWGTAVLPAGDYTFRFTGSTNYQLLRIRRGTQVVNMVMPLNGSSTGTSGGSSISIVGNRVRGFHLAPVGLTYSYGIPKNESQQILARLPHPTVVAVAVATTK